MSSTVDAPVMLDAALDYAERGWPVIPLHTPRPGGCCTCREGLKCQSPGKHPRIENWQTAATTDPAKIKEWWALWPDANIGVTWGKKAGIIDIEADNAEQDRLVLDLFDGNVPVCPMFKGGRFPHRLFKWRADLPGGAVIYYRDLGIRIGNSDKGAMSVVPPSLHASGVRYQWLPGLGPDDVLPPELPELVCTKLWNLAGGNHPEKNNGKPKSKRHALYEQPSVPEGNRDNVLYAEACALWNEQHAIHGDEAFDSDTYRKVVFERLAAWNAAKCKPPLDELQVIAKCDGARDWVRQQTAQESRAEVVTHPTSGAPVGWRLVIVDSDPPIYKLWSPHWDGAITLLGKQLRKFSAVCDAAAEQKQSWMPTTLARAWKDTSKYRALPGELLARAEHEEAPPELRTCESLGQLALDCLVTNCGHIVPIGADETPDPGGLPVKDERGGMFFTFAWLLTHVKKRDTDATRNALSEALRAAGVVDRSIGRDATKRRVKYAPPDVMARGVSLPFLGITF